MTNLMDLHEIRETFPAVHLGCGAWIYYSARQNKLAVGGGNCTASIAHRGLEFPSMYWPWLAG